MSSNKNTSVMDFSDFDGVSQDTRDSVQMQHDSLIGEKAAVNKGKGAAAGCKPGTSRKTFVLPLDLIDKITAIAAYTRRKEVAAVIDLLERGVASYEKEYGKDITALPKY